jgi:pantothenate kinase
MDIDESLVDRAVGLTAGGRALLGICGAPGAGKSTFSRRLAARVGDRAAVVPMDGFHLHDDELAQLGLSDRKGSPPTFDVHGYVAFLTRLRTETEHAVYAPDFDRSREVVVGGSIAVRAEHRLVVTEGNYLLYDAPGWCDVRPLLDEVWFVQTPDEVRVPRLVERHVVHGKDAAAAADWVRRSDEVNAMLVAATRERADLVVDLC